MSYKKIGKLTPGPVRNKYKSLLKYCDIDIETDKFAGLVTIVSFAISIAISINLFVIFSLSLTGALISLLLSFVGIHIIVYVILVLKSDSRSRQIENIMPDALLLMAMNIKSGMTTDRALIMAARPEFGPLEEELTHAGRQILGGKPIKQALLEMAIRVKSPLFDRTIRLIVEGIESGGELSDLLEQTAQDIQSTKIVENEVRSSVLMYAIFIFFASAIGAPLLFGISTYLVSTITTQSELYLVESQVTSVFASQLGNQPGLGSLGINPNFLVMFAIISLTITSIFASLIIGIIKDGRERAGIKLIPILVAMSISIFFLVRGFVSSILTV